MLSCLFESQKKIKDTRREEQRNREEIRRNADAEISRIHAETEAKKAKIDAAANHNATIISKFSSEIKSCNSTEELEKMWNEMSSQLVKY